MELTQKNIVIIVLVLVVVWVFYTSRNTEGFAFRIPSGMKWGDYVYYEDENEFPVADPSIVNDYAMYHH